MLPKLAPHQQAVFVPGTFGCGPSFGTSFEQQQAQVVAKLDVLFEYAKRSPKIGGFFGWHFLTRPSFQRGDCRTCKPLKSGKCDMNFLGAAESTMLSGFNCAPRLLIASPLQCRRLWQSCARSAATSSMPRPAGTCTCA